MRKGLVAASLGLLVATSIRPAQAAPAFFEPYGNLFSARTPLASPRDERSKDSIQGQAAKDERKERILMGPFFSKVLDLPLDIEVLTLGGGVVYANAKTPDHPWSLNINYANTDFDSDTFNLDAFDTRTFAVNGKYVLWTPSNKNLPIVSLVGSLLRVEDLPSVTQHDVLLAVDQEVYKQAFVTANVGYRSADVDILGIGTGADDFVAGIGATWSPLAKLSVSVDFEFENDVNGEDFWTASATYTIDKLSSIRFGGGKHKVIFGQYIARFDLK